MEKQMRQQMNQKVSREIIEIRHTLHAHPELSGKENNTKLLLMNFIREHTGLSVEDMGHWFYAVYEPKVPDHLAPVAFRADMDALPMPENLDISYASKEPGVSHKCGHDGHSAALAALALMLEDDERVVRPVYLIFQSAEETGEGGKACAAFLKDRGIREVYAFHNLSGYPENAVMVRDSLTQYASAGLTFCFTGRASHAGTPEHGINPAPALAHLEIFAEQLMREEADHVGETSSDGRMEEDRFLLITTVGINVGGQDFGISPGEGSVCFTLRAGSDARMNDVEKELADEAKRLAEIHGLTVHSSLTDVFPATVNDPDCAARVRQASEELGLTVVPMDKPWRPSEDFGWYLHECPGAMFYVGNGENWPAPHQEDYDFNDRILKTAPAIFLRLAETH
jgi:amidohydrolase